MGNYVQYYGVDTPPPERMLLNAGPVSMVFEPDLGFLRYIKLGDTEIVRGLYVAVRDRNWDTIAPQIGNVKLEQGDLGFELTFDVSCVQDDIDFFWQGKIAGRADGTVVYEMDGCSRSTFMRNRIGFCVLHAPSAYAGAPCLVEKDDGSTEEGHYPDAISPHQPFIDMRAISHEVIPGVTARVAFGGDVFEMEDQRNWTDASYKTYCTPLAIPFPVEVKEGDLVQQSVTLCLEGDVSRVSNNDASEQVLLTATGEQAVPLPEIGLGVASHGQPLSDQEVKRLRALHLSHLRVDLHLYQDDWKATFERAATESQVLNVKLEVALFLSDSAGAELEALLGVLNDSKPAVARWFVFYKDEKSTTAGWLKLASTILKAYDANVPVGAGSNAYFTELNRERPPVDDAECVVYSLNPQVHAFDHASLIETLEAQAWTVESARKFVGDLPISVSPVTLRPRFNPNATGPEADPEPGKLPSAVDVRQASLFGAAWTVGSLKYLSQAGVRSVTYYETTGWRGVLDLEEGSTVPFPSVPGGAFPLFHVLIDFGSMSGGEVVPMASSNTMCVDGMAMRKGPWVRFLMANMTAEPQTVKVSYPGLVGAIRTETMDETNVEAAMQDPESFRVKKTAEMGIGSVEAEDECFGLDLNPYAVVYAKAIVNVRSDLQI